MLPVTINSTACYLLDCEEAWGKSISGEFAVRSAIEDGLSQRENRSAFAASTTLSLNWRIYVEGAEARRWRAALRAYNNEPVLAPFWPAACLLSDLSDCDWTGGLRLFFEPGEPGEGITTYQVLAGATAPTSFTPSDDCMVVPLAWCRFDSLPFPEAADGDEAMDIDLKVVENGPAEYAIAASGVSLTGGPTIGALSPKLLDIIADWNASVASGGIDLRVDRERIGYGRSEATDYVDQSARRRQKVTLPPIGDETAKLVALFAQVGNVGSFWVPGAFADARLAADSSGASAIITVDDATHLADTNYIALVDPEVIAARKIQSRAGVALTLQSSPGPFAAGTAVCPLLLVRFATSKLKITWTTPTVATASVEVTELPTETVVPAGETVGTTIGDLGTPIWLYHVSDGDLDWRFTSFESEIDAGALGTFSPRPINHGDITSEINLQRHGVDLTVGWFAGSPFERARLDRLAPALTVQIYEGKLAAPAAAELIFTGKAAGYQFVGKKCTCKIAGPTALFDVRGPVAVTSPRCWTPLFSPRCGLVEAAVDAPAQLASRGDGVLFFEPTGGGGWPATVADHYRFGYAERTLADGSKRRLRITGSDAVITDGYTSPLRAGLVEWWDFPETGRVPRYGAAHGTALVKDTYALADYPDSIPVGSRRRAPGVVKVVGENHTGVALLTESALYDPATTEQFSCAIWFRRNQTSGSQEHIGWFGWNENSAVARISQIGDAISAWGPYAQSIGTITPSDPAAWLLVGVSLDNVAKVSRLYINGASVAGVLSSTWSLGDVGYNLLGLLVNGYGLLDQAIVWSRALSVDDFDALYNYGLGVTYPDTATPGDQLVVRHLGALSPAPAAYPETGWRLVPGCDKSFARCKALSNSANFRGFPHFPKSNPALLPIKQETPSAGKK